VVWGGGAGAVGCVTIVTEYELETTLGSATETAVMATVAGDGTAVGAVYTPELEIMPTVELPPVVPFTSHVTLVFEVPVTIAVNDWVVLV
jgi:hypothetical protein